MLTAMKDVIVVRASFDIVSKIAVDGGNVEDLVLAGAVEDEGLTHCTLEEVATATGVGDEVLHPLQTPHSQDVIRVVPQVAEVLYVRLQKDLPIPPVVAHLLGGVSSIAIDI